MEAADALGDTAYRNRIAAMRDKLATPGIGSWGQLLEWMDEFIGEPVIMADQLRQQLAATVQQVAFPWVAVDQFRQGANKGSESFGVRGLGHGNSISRC